MTPQTILDIILLAILVTFFAGMTYDFFYGLFRLWQKCQSEQPTAPQIQKPEPQPQTKPQPVAFSDYAAAFAVEPDPEVEVEPQIQNRLEIEIPDPWTLPLSKEEAKPFTFHRPIAPPSIQARLALPPAKTDPQTNYSKMNIRQLKAEVSAWNKANPKRKIKGVRNLKKQQLINALRQVTD